MPSSITLYPYGVSRSISLFRWLVIITWFFIFQPYLSPFPIEKDLQPFSLLLASLVLCLSVSVRAKYPAKYCFLFALAAFIELFHFFLFKKIAGIYFATYVYLIFAYRFSHRITASLIYFVMFFHLMGILWQHIDSVSFANFFEMFLRKLKHSTQSARGATGFTPEPSFAGALSTVYALIYYRFFSYQEKKSFSLVFALMYLLSLILTSSSLGYLFMPVVVFTMLPQARRMTTKNFLTVIFLIFIMFILTKFFFESYEVKQRGLVMVKKLLSDPLVLLSDSSIQERGRSLFVGFVAMLDAPLGLGHGNFPLATDLVRDKYDLENIFQYSRNVQGSASGFGSVMAGTGFMGLFYYFNVFLSLRGPKKIADMGLWVVAVAMFVFSFSPAFPLIYVILIMILKKDNSRSIARLN